MFWFFLALAFVTIVIAWVWGEALSALGRWSDERPNSQFARDIEIEMDPAKNRGEFDFGTLGLVFAIVLLFLLVPSAVTSNGQSISLHGNCARRRRERDHWHFRCGVCRNRPACA